MSERALFFGCWNEPGHDLFGLERSKPLPEERRMFDYCYGSKGISLDGNYAPRRGLRGAVRGQWLCWMAQGEGLEGRQRLGYDSEEFPQGLFLRHERDGWTLISWWDRTQGDERGGCNSTYLLPGSHDSAAMLAGLQEDFPHVTKNLQKAGVVLREVVP